MNIETLQQYCIRKADVEACFPFDDTTLVFKVRGKMFLLAALDRTPVGINLKCDPERAVELREKYPSVQPGYHMNKAHWNTVILDGSIPEAELRSWIDHSYELVAQGKRK